MNAGLISVENINYFVSSADMFLEWTLLENGKPIYTNTINDLNIEPQSSELLQLKYPQDIIRYGKEYFLNIIFRTKEKTYWSDKGHVVAGTQLRFDQTIDSILPSDCSKWKDLIVEETDRMIQVEGDTFSVSFDKQRGAIIEYSINNRIIISEPIVPCFWRVPTDNDEGGGDKSYAARWRKAGLDDYKIKTKQVELTRVSPKELVVKIVNELNFNTGTIIQYSQYTITSDGKINLSNRFTVDGQLPPLARVGLYTVLPKHYDEIEWYGKGPFESYEDRKESAFFGIWSGRVEDQFFDYLMPQENGNKTDVSWLRIKSAQSSNLLITSGSYIGFNIQNYSDKALNESKISNRLKRGNKSYLHIDHKQMGLGGDDSWSPRVHREYLLNKTSYQFEFTFGGE